MSDDMREAFERSMKDQFPGITMGERQGSAYWTPMIDNMWQGFQMAWKSQQPRGEALGYVLPSGIKQLKSDHPATIYAPDNAMVPGSHPVWLYDQPPAPEAVLGTELLLKISSQLLAGRWASECAEDWPETTGPEYAANVAEEDKERRRKMAVSLRRLWDSLAAAAPVEPATTPTKED